MMRILLVLSLVVIQIHSASAYYSVGFQSVASETAIRLLNAGAKFTSVPSAEQVADIYCRLGGHAPLLWEDKVNLPSAHDVQTRPILIEFEGDILPESVIPVISTDTFALNSGGPSVDDVKAHLTAQGIEVEAKKIQPKDIADFLKSASRPVVVVHRTSEVSPRMLSLASNTTVPISEVDISQYQICLWTAVIFFLLGLGAICAMVNMDVVPDNLLYAKFQSGRTEKRD